MRTPTHCGVLWTCFIWLGSSMVVLAKTSPWKQFKSRSSGTQIVTNIICVKWRPDAEPITQNPRGNSIRINIKYYIYKQSQYPQVSQCCTKLIKELLSHKNEINLARAVVTEQTKISETQPQTHPRTQKQGCDRSRGIPISNFSAHPSKNTLLIVAAPVPKYLDVAFILLSNAFYFSFSFSQARLLMYTWPHRMQLPPWNG